MPYAKELKRERKIEREKRCGTKAREETAPSSFPSSTNCVDLILVESLPMPAPASASTAVLDRFVLLSRPMVFDIMPQPLLKGLQSVTEMVFRGILRPQPWCLIKCLNWAAHLTSSPIILFSRDIALLARLALHLSCFNLFSLKESLPDEVAISLHFSSLSDTSKSFPFQTP